MFSLLKKIYDSFLDVLAPKVCVICDKLIQNEVYTFVCYKCLCSIEVAPETNILTNRLYKNFEKDDIAISQLYAIYSTKEVDEIGVMKAIHALKYANLPKIGYELGLELGNALNADNINDFDAVLPLPLHPAKKRERGYNQADFISQGVSKNLNIQVDYKSLKRKNYTISQTLLNSNERKQNVKNVFSANNIKLNGKYLLVDDVLTTGSTLNNAAITLINAGAREVVAATLVAAE